MERVSLDVAQPDVEARAEAGVGAGHDADAELVARLRAGDEGAFRALLRSHHRGVVRMIAAVVKRPAVAEEIAQEGGSLWCAGSTRFDGACSPGADFPDRDQHGQGAVAREMREIPASSLGRADDEDGGEPTVDPSRFQREGCGRATERLPASWRPRRAAAVGRDAGADRARSTSCRSSSAR